LRKGEGVLEECQPVKVTQEDDVRTPGYGKGFVSECPISREADHVVELVIWDKQPSKMQQIYLEYSFIYPALWEYDKSRWQAYQNCIVVIVLHQFLSYPYILRSSLAIGSLNIGAMMVPNECVGH
jgi:hypothetical protein